MLPIQPSPMDTTLVSARNDQTGGSAQYKQRNVDVTRPQGCLSQEQCLSQEPLYNPHAVLTAPQQRRLAERLPQRNRTFFAHLVLSDIGSVRDLRDLEVKLEEIRSRDQDSEVEKNYQTLEVLRQIGGENLFQKFIIDALERCQLCGLKTPVFEPLKDTGSVAVMEHIAHMRKPLTHEQQDAVFTAVGQQKKQSGYEFRAATDLMLQMDDDASRLECLRQAEQQVPSTENNPGIQLKTQDILLLSQFLGPLGSDASDLAVSLLCRCHANEYFALTDQRDWRNGTPKHKIMVSLRMLINAKGGLHHPDDKNKPFTIQDMAGIIEKMGYEVLADNLLNTYGLPHMYQPAAEPMETDKLTPGEFGEVLHSLYHQFTGNDRVIWESLAGVFGIPRHSACNCYQGMNCSPRRRAGKLAVIIGSQNIPGGLGWNSLVKTIESAKLHCPCRPESLKTYPPYCDRPNELLLKKELSGVMCEWWRLGSQLDFPPQVIYEIESRYEPRHSSVALDQLIVLYMRKRTASWRQIRDVLVSIGQMAIAEEIERKYLKA